MGFPRFFTAALAFVLLQGCVVEGWYAIQGRVTRDRLGEEVPAEGVSVVAKGGKAGGSDRVITGSDGRYELLYRYGGMCLFLLCTSYGDGSPRLEFTSPEGAVLAIPVRGGDAEPGVVRYSCAHEGQFPKHCYEVDVVVPGPTD